MTPTAIKKRRAPPIAAKNAEKALSNLFQKRDVLVRTLNEQSRSDTSWKVPETLPKSIRQFNLWKGESLQPGKRAETVKFYANSNETLRANSDLRNEVQLLVDAVRKLGERKLGGRREDTLRALRSQLKVERELTAIANREVVRTRFLFCELRDSHWNLQDSRKSLSEEAQERIAELEAQVRKLEAEVVALRGKLRINRTLKSV